MTTYHISTGSTFCMIHLLDIGTLEITNNLLPNDELKYREENDYFPTLSRGATATISSTEGPIYLIIGLSNSNGNRRFSYTITDTKDNIPSEFVIKDSQILNDEIPTRTPSPPSESSTSSSSESSQTSETRPSSSSHLHSSSSESSESNIAARTPNFTPFPTWNGLYADPPGVIIRGDDIPEIRETHPPIPTDFILPEVPKATKIATISTGTILIIVIVILTILNIFRSAKKLKDSRVQFEDSDVSDLEITNSISYTYSMISAESNENDAFITKS